MNLIQLTFTGTGEYQVFVNPHHIDRVVSHGAAGTRVFTEGSTLDVCESAETIASLWRDAMKQEVR